PVRPAAVGTVVPAMPRPQAACACGSTLPSAPSPLARRLSSTTANASSAAAGFNELVQASTRTHPALTADGTRTDAGPAALLLNEQFFFGGLLAGTLALRGLRAGKHVEPGLQPAQYGGHLRDRAGHALAHLRVRFFHRFEHAGDHLVRAHDLGAQQLESLFHH